MKLDVRILNRPSNIQILSISGNIESGHVTPIGSEFEKLCQGPAVNLILDVGGVDGISVSGIGQLIKARNEITGCGGKVVLIGVNSRMERMINISGLHEYFPIALSETDAIEFLRH